MLTHQKHEVELRYNQAKAILKQAQRAVQRSSSEAALIATQAGFHSGCRTALDFIIAEREVLYAEKDYARYDYLLDRLSLKQTVGILSSEDLAKNKNLLVSVTK